VKHQAAPTIPDSVSKIYSPFVAENLQRFADVLASEAVLRGLIGPREVPRLWERHLLNCATLADLIPRGASVCDLGSGAGLPGLVLGIVRSDLRITLVEPLLRRTDFLDAVVPELGLEQVEVIRGRAESLHGRRAFQVVTARALAPMSRLVTWAMPLVAPDGVLLAMKGRSAADELVDAREALLRLRCGEPDILVLPHPGVTPGVQAGAESQTTVIRVSRAVGGR
jgi:16S rRNA (guanine527-N7)-methyltransferase